jgi:hypothetical protein
MRSKNNNFNQEDIHILRYNNLIEGTRYEKLYYYKIEKLLQYIKEKILNKYDYILFLDATDTNFIKTPERLIERFLNMNCDILMGAEKGLWPKTKYTHLYGQKNIIDEYKYLNSGTYFGKTKSIVEGLESIVKNKYLENIDDQGMWTIEYLLNDYIQIDYKQEFFFSTYESKNKILINSGNVSLIDSNAFVIHDNGADTENTIKLTHELK